MTPHRPSCGARRRRFSCRRFLALNWRRTTWLVLSAGLLCALLALRSHFEIVLVVGSSMHPTLESSDILLVRKGVYQDVDPGRGEMVVARFRSEFIVKRVVGLPGESVEVVDSVLRIDGRPIDEHHAINPGDLSVGCGKLSGDRFAVLGDNRAMSEGILFYAVIPRDALVGRVMGGIRFQGAGWGWHGPRDLATIPDPTRDFGARRNGPFHPSPVRTDGRG